MNGIKILVLTLFFLGSIQPEKKITIWLIGDSTVCDQPLDRAPVTGWGTPFSHYIDTTATVVNKARGGRSTRTFISEGRWKEVIDNMKKGDFLLIQFGHNDEAKEPQYADRYTSVPDYKKNLKMFIAETRAKGGTPILISPVTRMRFNSDGVPQETHVEYTRAVKETGLEASASVIDLDGMSLKLLRELGPDKSQFLYMYVDSLQNPHYPKGRQDWTHFNEYGARRMAELVLNEIKRQDLSLADYITKKVAP